jgi:cytochrome bd ubiquinol oxidase subunit I
MDALALHRFHFAFTITYHYLFPQLTMGLALLIVILKTQALQGGGEHFNRAAQFWGRIFAINFAMGVVTGIPMEFQFGTSWAPFSKTAGGVIGQTLAMEGVFSFFLESTFLGLFLSGEKRLGPRGHWWAAFAVLAGAWLSGFFIIATNAWMQHPVGYTRGADGRFLLTSLWGLLSNPWAIWQYLHNMAGSVVTAAVVMAAIGAFYILQDTHQAYARTFLRLGITAGLAGSLLMLFPTGDGQVRNVARYQPATLAAMEGLFETTQGAPMIIIGQPDTVKKTLDNPIRVPRMLSFLTHQKWMAEVKGLDAFPEADQPRDIELLYYSYRMMVGLGTIFMALMVVSAWKLWRGRLFDSPGWLWVIMLTLPFPYIANTAGWITAEVGRQPWLIHGLMRTSAGASMNVSAGNAMFTLIGFMGMYTVLSILFLFLVYREIDHGPEPAQQTAEGR